MSFAAENLRSFIARIQRLEEEKAAMTSDITEVYKEAKGQGFDTKILRETIRMLRMDKADRDEHRSVLDLYLDAAEAEPETRAAIIRMVETAPRLAEVSA